MDKRCKGCAAIKGCPTACEYGSIMCTMKRMQTGQTKGDLERKNIRKCPHCGMPIT